MPYYYTHSAFRDRTKYLSLSFVTDYLRSRVAHAHYAGRMVSVSYELCVSDCLQYPVCLFYDTVNIVVTDFGF